VKPVPNVVLPPGSTIPLPDDPTHAAVDAAWHASQAAEKAAQAVEAFKKHIQDKKEAAAAANSTNASLISSDANDSNPAALMITQRGESSLTLQEKCSVALTHSAELLDMIRLQMHGKGAMETSLLLVATDTRNVLEALKEHRLKFAKFYMMEWTTAMFAHKLVDFYVCEPASTFGYNNVTGGVVEEKLATIEASIMDHCVDYIDHQSMNALMQMTKVASVISKCVRYTYLPKGSPEERDAYMQAYAESFATRQGKAGNRAKDSKEYQLEANLSKRVFCLSRLMGLGKLCLKQESKSR